MRIVIPVRDPKRVCSQTTVRSRDRKLRVSPDLPSFAAPTTPAPSAALRVIKKNNYATSCPTGALVYACEMIENGFMNCKSRPASRGCSSSSNSSSCPQHNLPCLFQVQVHHITSNMNQGERCKWPLIMKSGRCRWM